jgi:succinyl-diaminopimelate desuccinylase
MADFSHLDSYLQQNRQSHLDQLCELLRIPSLSADSAYAASLKKAADWLTSKFKSMGLETKQLGSEVAPLVYAETPPVPGAPVVLVYGHYDVQPPDPLELWETPPFEPAVRDGKLYARGATDDKGQMLTHVLSLEAYLKSGNKLRCQVKYIIEGQEESGSEVIEVALPGLREQLACDVIIISDNSQYAKGQPAITYGLRGLAYFELHVQGPKVDLHSGVFGGAVTNPAYALAQMLVGMKDAKGRIQLPGFYDSVKPIDPTEREEWKKLNFKDEDFAKQVGVPSVHGEEGYTSIERRWARPSFDIHGLTCGYQGEGAKTVLPSKASAKLSFRLVPDQTPAEVAKQLEAYVAANTPAGVTAKVVDLHGGPGVVVDPNSRFMKAAEKAVEEGFGKAPVLMREGGSIPIVAAMVKELKCDAILMGWGLDDDGAHSPNEKFTVEDFYRGIKSSSRLWEFLPG